MKHEIQNQYWDLIRDFKQTDDELFRFNYTLSSEVGFIQDHTKEGLQNGGHEKSGLYV